MSGMRNISKFIFTIISFFFLPQCYSVKYIQPSIPDLELTPVEYPKIPEDSELWNNQDFVNIVNYSLKLEIQLDAYKSYIKSLSGSDSK